MSKSKKRSAHLNDLEREYQMALDAIPARIHAPLKPYLDETPRERTGGRHKTFTTICGACMESGQPKLEPWEFVSHDPQGAADALREHYARVHHVVRALA